MPADFLDQGGAASVHDQPLPLLAGVLCTWVGLREIFWRGCSLQEEGYMRGLPDFGGGRMLHPLPQSWSSPYRDGGPKTSVGSVIMLSPGPCRPLDLKHKVIGIDRVKHGEGLRRKDQRPRCGVSEVP